MEITSIHGPLYFCNNHDSTISIFKDGNIKEIFIEERYSRKKHDGCYPKRSLKRTNSDIYLIKEDPEIKILNSLINKNINFGEIKSSMVEYYHHICHALESFYFSGFNHSAILVVDGNGTDNETISLFSIDNNYNIKIHRVYKVNSTEKLTKKSLGCIYNKAVSVVGLSQKYDIGNEGKFMGLSSYGTPSVGNIINFSIEDGVSHTMGDYVNENYPYTSNCDGNSSLFHYINFAATVQRDFNNVILDLVKYIKNLTGEENLCLSGGCFQNVISNNIICESEVFKNIYCSPFPSDGGISVGMGIHWLLSNNHQIGRVKINHAYWGEEYPDEKILSYIDKEKYSLTDITPQEVAKLLSEDKILAWFQDRSEYGPRALGHRSLIGNPGNRENFNILNNKIKHRENWRPLAPSVPDELFDILFDVKSKDLTQFMLRSIPIREEWRSRIPAVCHVDGTTRPQRLERDINPEYYDMIMEFYKLTELPCVINTSFNGPGEPIIENPKEALEFLDKTPELYGIVFNGKYLIRVVNG